MRGKFMINITIKIFRARVVRNRRWLSVTVLAFLLGLGFADIAAAQTPAIRNTKASGEISDAALVRSLSGFKNGYAEVNGIRLHYVAGGKGQPLVLLPGWLET